MWPLWRVQAADFDVDRFLREFPAVAPGRVWHRGEPTRRGPASDSGFSVRLPDAESVAHVIEGAGAYFAPLVAACHALNELGVSSTLDIGTTIDLPRVVGRFIRIETAASRWLADLGIDLVLSVYVATDEAAEPT